MKRVLTVAFLVVLVAVLASVAVVDTSRLAGTSIGSVPAALAYTCNNGPLGPCGGTWNPNYNPSEGTASLTVEHVAAIGDTDYYVEPDDTDTWDVEVVWASHDSRAWGGHPCPCDELKTTVSVDVTWTGSTWTATCTGCNSVLGPVYRVSVCNTPSCQLPAHSHKYELIVEATDLRMGCTSSNYPYFMDHVNFTSTAIDDGDTLDASGCSEVTSVSPTSQTWSATDNAISCTFSCAATGPTETIYYEN